MASNTAITNEILENFRESLASSQKCKLNFKINEIPISFKPNETEKIVELQKSIKELENNVRELNRDNAKLTSSIASTSKKISVLSKDNEELEEEIVAFKTSGYDDIKSQYEALKIVINKYHENLGVKVKVMERIAVSDTYHYLINMRIMLPKKCSITFKGRTDEGWEFINSEPKLPEELRANLLKNYTETKNLAAFVFSLRNIFISSMETE